MTKDSLGEHKGLSKLTMNGGKGQEGIAIVDGSVLTLKEGAAVAIAKDIWDDVKRANPGKKAKEIPLIEAARRAMGRGRPGICTEDQIMQEVCRIQNHEIYGGRLARR